MFGMSKTPSYREARSAAAVESSDRAALPILGVVQAGSGYVGQGRLVTCSLPLWGWLFPGSPVYQSALVSSAGDEPVVLTEELQLDTPAPGNEKEQGERVVESNGPVTVVIRRAE